MDLYSWQLQAKFPQATRVFKLKSTMSIKGKLHSLTLLDELPSIDKQKMTLWGQWGADLKQGYRPYSTLERCALTAKAHWIWIVSKPKGVRGRCSAHSRSFHCSHEISHLLTHSPSVHTYLKHVLASRSPFFLVVLVISHSVTSLTHRTLVCPRAAWIRWNRGLEKDRAFVNLTSP